MFDIFMYAINAVMPIIMLIVLGYLLRRSGFLDENFVKRGELYVRFACGKGVICDNVHAQSTCALSNKCADCAEAYNAEGFAENFGTRKVAFAFFNELAYVFALTLKGFAPVNSGGNLS